MTSEDAAYLLERIKNLEAVIQSMGDAINNVDVRLMVAERAIASIKHRLDGDEFDETKAKWWN